LYKFKLYRQEKLLYICDTLHMLEWVIQVLDIYEGREKDVVPACLGGRGATPPEFCGGGPTGNGKKAAILAVRYRDWAL